MLAKNFLEKFLKNNKLKIKYAIFDFDNTIYPGLLLYELATEHIKNLKGKNKLEKKILLIKIAAYFKKNNFKKSLKLFLKFLKDEPVFEFYDQTKQKLKKIPNKFRQIIKILHESKIKCYLVSLTSDTIARKVCKKFKFENFLSLEFGTYKKSNKSFFDGKIKTKLNNLKLFKLSAYKRFKIRNPKQECICFGDSLDDLLILKKSAKSFVIGKNNKLITKLNKKCLLIDKRWIKIKKIK